MAKLATKFASQSQEWVTPPEVIEPLRREFIFDLDVAATESNRQCERFYSVDNDALTQRWSGVCWMNPPFNCIGAWVKKAFIEASEGRATVVCLVPARTNTNWFHDYCLKGEVRFLRGRPKFVGCSHGLPQPLAIVIFYKRNVLGSDYAKMLNSGM